MVYLSIWLKPLFPYIDYELNKAYIIESLCVEREKEVNTCQGQCHLNQEIEKNAAQEEDNRNRIPRQNFENEVFFITLTGFKSPQPETINCKLCIYISNYRYQLNKNHFHPPELA